MNNKYEKAKEILKKYNQEHVINYINKADLNIREKLINQILNIDFEELKELYKKTTESINNNISNLEPISGINPEKLSDKEKKEIIDIGEKIIKSNKYAVATMAGGQGTRLGHSGPKGTFKMNLNGAEKSLFEVIVDTLKTANNKYSVVIPWYIMTSDENNNETVNFLENNNYFGYPKDYIYIFKQSKLPLLDKEGKLLIGEDGLIKEASNGNGGIFKSMLDKNAINDMEKRGIEWIFIGSIDNVLLKYVDIMLLGLTSKQKNLIGTRSVLKISPEERVGVLCKQDGKVGVIEYTELPENIAKMKNLSGELAFGESHIMCNLFNIEAIKRCSKNEMQYHVAFKKSNYLDENGKLVNPKEPNAYKFEQFIFDSFKVFDSISILRGKREEDFAPVKNMSGADSPETAKKLYENYWKNK